MNQLQFLILTNLKSNIEQMNNFIFDGKMLQLSGAKDKAVTEDLNYLIKEIDVAKITFTETYNLLSKITVDEVEFLTPILAGVVNAKVLIAAARLKMDELTEKIYKKDAE
jgi:hypothetical protein